MAYYRFKFSLRDIKLILFKKKRCKICGEKLLLVKHNKEIEKPYVYLSMMDRRSYSDNYDVEAGYYCRECKIKYTLDELVR